MTYIASFLLLYEFLSSLTASKAPNLGCGTHFNALYFDLQSGQERYRTVVRSYYRGAVAAFLVYDLSSRHSFDNLYAWVRELREFAPPEMTIMILGNKSDQGRRYVSYYHSDSELQGLIGTGRRFCERAWFSVHGGFGKDRGECARGNAVVNSSFLQFLGIWRDCEANLLSSGIRSSSSRGTTWTEFTRFPDQWYLYWGAEKYLPVLAMIHQGWWK